MKELLFIVGLVISMQLHAQTGIGTTAPHASAKLDISSSNKGFLPPRISLTTATDVTTISSPATGLLVYCNGDAGLAAGYYYWNGAAWATIATSGGSGSFAATYLRGSKTAVQTMAINDVVSFSQIDNAAGSAISLNTSTGKITLAAGNTYRLIASVPNFIGSRPSFMWYNETTSAYIGSASNGYSPSDGAGNGSFGGISEVIITPNTSTVVSFRLYASTSSITAGGNADFSTAGIYPWFEAQVISGNTPVTGQSVDYVSVQASSDLGSITTGSAVKFNSILAGNIPYDPSTGLFTLTAGKTYRLTGIVTLGTQAAGTGTSAEANIVWRTGTAASGTNIGNYGQILSGNSSYNGNGQGVAEIIYTPTTNTTVLLYVSSIGSTVAFRGGYTNAIVQQIGSSAFVNPWTLSGSNTYNTTGNVGIGTSNPTQALDVTGNVNITGKLNITDLTGNVVTKVSGFVNAGSFLTMDNLKFTVTTSGSRGLGIATVSGTVSAMISATYGNIAGAGGFATSPPGVSISTSTSNSIFNWHFGNAGDGITYIVNETTNNKVYRVTLMIGPGYSNNFISIERLL